METVEVVIRIPKKVLKDIQCVANGLWGRKNLDDLELAILDGTVLPKGHERLIAEPTEEDIAKTIGGQNDFAECIREAVKAVFDNAPAIIEADEGASNETG